jgi:serine/threonine-protein kinase
MNTRDQFGNYLLLKRLGEDALGETFRAGKVGRQTLERVVLLRVLNAQGFDAERIARSLQARAGLGQALKSPNIGHAVDVGQVRGVPYVAYDYSSGRTLGQLFEQSARRNSPLPVDHALLVAERLALGLAVAFETRFGDDRVQHGFVVPGFVQVSNEGELKLLGFEASAGLRESAAHPLIKQAVGRYLAPEVVAGQPPSRADDVYSLGAVLFEMLTGQQVPLMPAGGLGPVLDPATSAADGAPLAPEIVALLKRTLCPRDQRIADAVTWHKTIAKLMADAGYGATTFNLAFFLHNLFRDEIEREGREIETEKSQAEQLIAAAPARAAEPAAPAAPSPVRESGPVREDTSVLREAYGLPAKKSSNTGVLVGAGVGALAILGVVGYLLLGRGGSEPVVEPPEATAPVEVAPPVATAPEPTGMTPEQIQALIDQALAEQKKQLEAGLQAQTDQKLEELQKKLADAQKARVAAATPQPVAPTAARIENLPLQSAPSRAEGIDAMSPPATTPPPAAKPQPEPQAPAPAATTPKPAPATSQRAATPPASAAASVPESGGVRQGDLVSPGPGVTPPRVVRAPALSYPPLAKRMQREATVGVRVLVDENGRAAEVQPTGSKAGFGMDDAAVDYARNCVWEPARKNGIKVKMWFDLKVSFTLRGG